MLRLWLAVLYCLAWSGVTLNIEPNQYEGWSAYSNSLCATDFGATLESLLGYWRVSCTGFVCNYSARSCRREKLVQLIEPSRCLYARASTRRGITKPTMMVRNNIEEINGQNDALRPVLAGLATVCKYGFRSKDWPISW